MKAKDLIKQLQTIPEDAEVVTPGFDETYAASEFSLEPCHIMWNVREATPHFAPHDFISLSEKCVALAWIKPPVLSSHTLNDYDLDGNLKINGYVLDGKW